MSGPIKWHGGKHYIRKQILALMPPRCHNPNAPAIDDAGWLHFVSPFVGGAAVELELDPEGISEVWNDRYKHLTNFWRCLACPASFSEFIRKTEALPFCDQFWREARERLSRPCDAPGMICIACAVAFFVTCRQSLAGRMKDFAPLTRQRTRRGMNEQASAWLNAVDGLPGVHDRIRRVVILNDDALKVIKQQDGPRTLFYLDPPYVPETRATTGEYAHEMTVTQHADLLCVLSSIQGRFLLSGYRSKLYDDHATLQRWNRHDFELPNNAAKGDEKRRMTECVWTNY